MKPDSKYVMTYWERIEGPMQSTKGSALGERLCWQVAEASLTGENIHARSTMAGTDWMRLGKDGIRRADNRIQFVTIDHEPILFSYDNAIIKPSDIFFKAWEEGKGSNFEDQYMRISPRFQTAEGKYSWLEQNIFIGIGRLFGHKQIIYEIFMVL
ncbi:MAG: DUF3237 family protein [Chitinophagaceae bacterium]|nr:MAG: DUF3237 family protein [Chitinophagaceae bacterium]